MNTKEAIKEIHIGTDKISLSLQNNQPLAEWNNHTFKHLWFLVRAIPNLSNPSYITTFAEISNFFWKGQQFQCIASIPKFQEEYRRQVEMEKKHPADVFPFRLTDYKIFDVSVMHEPKIIKDQLIYYTFNISNGLPYRVVCPYPYPSASTLIHYQILPILGE